MAITASHATEQTTPPTPFVIINHLALNDAAANGPTSRLRETLGELIHYGIGTYVFQCLRLEII